MNLYLLTSLACYGNWITGIRGDNDIHMDKRLILFASAVILCLFIIYLAYQIIYEKTKRYIKENSEHYRYLEWLQQRLSAEELSPHYLYRVPMKTKSQLDRINIDKQMLILTSSGIPPLELVRKGMANQGKTIEFERLLQKAPPYRESKGLLSFFEKKLSEELERRIRPTIPVFEISFFYTSPQGRNSYHRNCSFTPEMIFKYSEQVKQINNNKQSIQYQRSLMTDSLRYDIMKRDGFQCVLCGAKASDGIKLHVDHIQPVSKGGKTERSNLRTLCDRCNMGKRDKYDRFGMN